MVSTKVTLVKICFIAVVLLLCGVFDPMNVEAADKQKIWDTVKEKAKKAAEGDEKRMWKKHIWRELKKLKPEELIECGEQVCEEAQKGGWDSFGLHVTTNAILSYHANKTGWDETAKEVGAIIVRSNNSDWVDCSLAWITNNDHYKEISVKGMHSISEGINKAIREVKKSFEIKEIILKRNIGFWFNLKEEDRKAIKKTLEDISKGAENQRAKEYAEWGLKMIEFTEWQHKKAQGIRPLGPKPEYPTLKKKPKKKAVNKAELEPNEYFDEKGEKKSILEYDVLKIGTVPRSAIEGLNRKKSLPELIKVLKEEKNPQKVSTAAYILSYLKEKDAVPILANQTKNKYSGKTTFKETQCCLEMVVCMGRFARSNDEAYEYLKKYLNFDYWSDIKWRASFGNLETTKTLLVTHSVIAISYSKRPEAIKVLEEIEKKEEYQKNEELKWRISNTISSLKKLEKKI